MPGYLCSPSFDGAFVRPIAPPAMGPFILSRMHERPAKSVGRVLFYALGFFVATRLLSGLLIGAASMLYSLAGCADPLAALQFGGMPDVAVKNFGANLWWMLLVGAPLLEECAFRLALSFRRPHVAIGLGTLAGFLVMRLAPAESLFAGYGGGAIVAAAVAAVVWSTTSEAFWLSKQPAWQLPAGWCSAIGFGLAHLFAMPGLSWTLLPFALCICFMLACAGCVFVYLRVNLGFGWALAAHMLNNIPALAMLATAA